MDRFASTTATALLLAAFLAPRLCSAQVPLRDGFEGPQPSWTEAGSDAHYRLESHARIQELPHAGQWCEHFRITGENGTYVYVASAIPPSRVISELIPSVWVRADRPGMQMSARLVFPRTPSPRDGRPLTAVIHGGGYTQVGVWQRLQLEDLPRLVDQSVRVLRAQFGSGVDGREAYIDQVLLNVYGGPGTTNVWIDDLEVAGTVAPNAMGASFSQGNAPQSAAAADTQNWTARPAPEARNQAPPTVALSGGLLSIAGHPFFPRIVQYSGEPLERLKSLGFNTVWLEARPNADLIDQAARAGLWLIAPPPAVRDLESKGERRGVAIPPALDGVLAWNLGSGLNERELESTKRWAKLIRAADPRSRPLVCAPDAELKEYSRIPSALLYAHRAPLGSTLQPTDYAVWLRDRLQLARPGTPLWTFIQTQPARALSEQDAAFMRGQLPASQVQDEQVRLTTRLALTVGARALVFESHSALDASDPQTQHRAALLELINLELSLIEPWAAAGSVVASAASSDVQVAAVVLQTDRARLLVPLYSPPQSQLVIGAQPGGLVTFVAPGVPEGHNAWELSPVGIRPLEAVRVAGGTRVALRDAERESLVVFTDDAAVQQSLKKRVEAVSHRAASLQRFLAAQNLARVSAVTARLAGQGRALSDATSKLTEAQGSLRQSEALENSGNVRDGFLQARRTDGTLRQLERAYWQAAAAENKLPLAVPLAANFNTLPDFWLLTNELSAARPGLNRLQGGDFENFNSMLQAGWRHFQHPQPGVVNTVELSGEGAHGGHFALRLRAAPAPPIERAPALVEGPPLWITSAAVPVEQGQLLQIRGWARVPTPITGSVDGLLILDSLGGEALATRLAPGIDWREFLFYRAATRSGQMTLTFVLTGLGEAWFDDVSVQVIERGPGSRFDQASQTIGTSQAIGRGPFPRP